ncbi:uncharacterized protein LOC132545065 [Ylistrum balloti]|uniref:uncharacterized protein LOC132545065 n=1 Tax=Ylistrum balloti TaxID=509963 RepID=UPI002905EBEE|nr:uncharacterized protein LOC132545065 [Ylistrum balloti]
MATSKVTPATESMQVDDDAPSVESGKVDDTAKPLKKKRPKPWKTYYRNRDVEKKLDRLEQTVEKIKTEKKIYKTSIKEILKHVKFQTIADSVVIGNDTVIVKNENGNEEELDKIMKRHFEKVTCEHAAISKELATLKHALDISTVCLQQKSKQSDRKLQTILELLEMTKSSNDDFFTDKIEKALKAIQKWSDDSKRTLADSYKATSDQAPKEALSTIQFVASKCVDKHTREELKRLLDIDQHAMEDEPNDLNLCFRGLLFWRQKDPETNNAERLKKLLQDLDDMTFERRKQDSRSVLKLNVGDRNIMDGEREQGFVRMQRNVEEILDHVTSISQKLATTEHRDILNIIQPGESVTGQGQSQPIFGDMQRRVRRLSVRAPSPPKRSRNERESC